MFQKFNFDTEWAVKLISRITNDEDIPIEGDAIVKQVNELLILSNVRLNLSFGIFQTTNLDIPKKSFLPCKSMQRSTSSA